MKRNFIAKRNKIIHRKLEASSQFATLATTKSECEPPASRSPPQSTHSALSVCPSGRSFFLLKLCCLSLLCLSQPGSQPASQPGFRSVWESQWVSKVIQMYLSLKWIVRNFTRVENEHNLQGKLAQLRQPAGPIGGKYASLVKRILLSGPRRVSQSTWVSLRLFNCSLSVRIVIFWQSKSCTPARYPETQSATVTASVRLWVCKLLYDSSTNLYYNWKAGLVSTYCKLHRNKIDRQILTHADR